jgi:hypothetical protein
VTCKHCGEPIEPDKRQYRGSTGYKHTSGRVFCRGVYSMHKAEPLRPHSIKVCDICGGELVEVDNPMRLELRHRRGVQCPRSEPLENQP